MRISDWSSDVCSSDLAARAAQPRPEAEHSLLQRDQDAADARALTRHRIDDDQDDGPPGPSFFFSSKRFCRILTRARFPLTSTAPALLPCSACTLPCGVLSSAPASPSPSPISAAARNCPLSTR